MSLKSRFALMVLVLGCALAPATMAKTFKYANQGDALSMDPHSMNESFQLSFLGNVYESLVGRGKNLELVPALAVRWKQTEPTVWRFELRKGVRFHDGTPFTADDVVFSFERARGEGSDVKTFVQEISEVRKVDAHTIDVATRVPFPILPDVITQWYIMSERWCQTNQAINPVDRRKGTENAASFKANGTGPFRLRARDPGVRTVLARNARYWGKIESNIDQAVFTPIQNPATRVAALLSGEIDMMEPVPVQDIKRLNASTELSVLQGPELRTIFLGMDQFRDELLYSSVKGKNPFKDVRVRRAVYQAIDTETIAKTIMGGAATPTALMIAPGIRGFDASLNKRLPYDPEASKALLAQAGYPEGFELEFNCPNNRYVNDEAICKAVTSMLARVGIRAKLLAEPKATYFPKILSRKTSLYLLGWTPSTYDAHNPLNALMSTPDKDSGRGQFNLGGYSHAEVDRLTVEIASEADPVVRAAKIKDAMKIHQDDVGHIPLHQQALAWAMKKNISTVQRADNALVLKWTVVR